MINIDLHEVPGAGGLRLMKT